MKFKTLLVLVGCIGFTAMGETAHKTKAKQVALIEDSNDIVAETVVPTRSFVEFIPMLGVSISEVSVTTTFASETSAKGALNLGLLTNFNLNRRFSIETGLLYVPRVTGNKVFGSTAETTIRQNVLQLPVMARLWVGRNFNFGFGGYVSQAVGDMSVSGTLPDTNGGTREVTSNDFKDRSYKNLGIEKLDYGLTGGIQGRIPVASQFELVWDGRLDFGLRDLRTNPKSNTLSIHGHALRFFVGGALSL